MAELTCLERSLSESVRRLGREAEEREKRLNARIGDLSGQVEALSGQVAILTELLNSLLKGSEP